MSKETSRTSRVAMGESIRDRLASLTRRELTGLVAVVLVALAGVGLWYVRSMPRPVEVRSALQQTGAGPSAGGDGPAGGNRGCHSADLDRLQCHFSEDAHDRQERLERGHGGWVDRVWLRVRR